MDEYFYLVLAWFIFDVALRLVGEVRARKREKT